MSNPDSISHCFEATFSGSPETSPVMDSTERAGKLPEGRAGLCTQPCKHASYSSPAAGHGPSTSEHIGGLALGSHLPALRKPRSSVDVKGLGLGTVNPVSLLCYRLSSYGHSVPNSYLNKWYLSLPSPFPAPSVPSLSKGAFLLKAVLIGETVLPFPKRGNPPPQ